MAPADPCCHGRRVAPILTAVACLLLGQIPLQPALAADSGFSEIRAAIRARDYARAIPMLESRARSGDPEAQYQLAAMHRTGTGVAKDHEAAFRWLGRAAGQGHLQAQYNLGIMYEFGWGTPADATQAADWYRKAAERGHPMARRKLAGAGGSASRSCCGARR